MLEQANSGMDLVVARILDGPVVERESGVMGGMSGSPVYVNGKLLGATAYTWHWEKESSRSWHWPGARAPEPSKAWFGEMGKRWWPILPDG